MTRMGSPACAASLTGPLFSVLLFTSNLKPVISFRSPVPLRNFSHQSASTASSASPVLGRPIFPARGPILARKMSLAPKALAAASSAAAPATRLQFGDVGGDSPKSVVVVGHRDAVTSEGMSKYIPSIDAQILKAMLADVKEGDNGADVSSYMQDAKGAPFKLVLVILPDPKKTSRHNSPFRPHVFAKKVGPASSSGKNVQILVAVESAEDVAPVACAIAKAFPLFSLKSKEPKNDKSDEDADEPKTVTTRFIQWSTGEELTNSDVLKSASVAAEGVRFAQRLVDMPPELLNVSEFVGEASMVAKAHKGVEMTVIRGTELRDKGYGCLWGVGKAARDPPALVVLSRRKEASKRSVCIVGKGIVYDTGGLSLKVGGTMPHMKTDMGGAAAMLAAFDAALKLDTPDTLHCILCIAENSIGPLAVRNDDVLICYSEKTIEINNTDAEGRLVLADGVAHATKHLDPDLVIDMATLTGAQLITTGKRHAAILCNTEEVEQEAIKAGKRSGDLVHPIPYCPEFFKQEFDSKVADMKNSVKDRANAQSSCAGHFIEAHLHKDYKGGWLHVDMAGPSSLEERGTGYGVGLVLAMLKAKGFE